jgi:hypothetical protein
MGKMDWRQWIVVAAGALLFVMGAHRFFLRHSFGIRDAVNCCLTIFAAGLLLLVFDYVLHHARMVAVIPLLAAGVLIFSSPVFDVSLGLTLMGAMVLPALSEWKSRKAPANTPA